MTQEDLGAIEAREAAATPGPWDYDQAHGECENTETCPNGIERDKRGSADECEDCGHWYLEDSASLSGPTYLGDHEDEGFCTKDAEFIAHARADVPALIAEVKRMNAEVERLTRERDAAVADLRRVSKAHEDCHACAHIGGNTARCDFGEDCWEWRGAQA